MRRSTFTRFCFCLVVLNLIVPVSIPAQQLPPSVMLEVNTDPQGQVGAIVRTLEPGPNVADLGAFLSNQFLIPWVLALRDRRRPAPTMEPLFDRGEVPNGLMRLWLTFAPVRIPIGKPFTPGLVGFILPTRISQTLTPESFLESFLGDFMIEVNGVKFMDSDLYTPQHVTMSNPLPGLLFGLPGITVQFWGLNVTQKITRPGTYVIRNHIRIPKTVPFPELSAFFPALARLPAGEIVIQQTINVQP